MAYTLWSVLTWVVLPPGVLLAAAAVSGVRFLEQLAHRICIAEIQIGETLMPVVAIIAGFCVVIFGGESMALQRLKRERQFGVAGISYSPQWRASLWRHQRNWWLALTSLLLWLIVWRISGVLATLRDESERLDQEHKGLLKQRTQRSLARSGSISTERRISESLDTNQQKRRQRLPSKGGDTKQAAEPCAAPLFTKSD